MGMGFFVFFWGGGGGAMSHIEFKKWQCPLLIYLCNFHVDYKVMYLHVEFKDWSLIFFSC